MQASYDFENHLVQLGTRDYTAYSYDADGNRLGVSTRLWAPGAAPTGAVSGTTTVYLVDPTATYARVVLESSGGYSPTRYEYGDDLLRMVGTGGASSYYLYDGLGSTRQLTDGSGVVTDSYLYDAYGVGLARTGSTVNSFLFQGQQYDAASGAYYLRARYYDQNNGRFISQDPFGGSNDDPISLHRYLYASDDPTDRVDPSGNSDNLASLSVVAGGIATIAASELPAIEPAGLSAEEIAPQLGQEAAAVGESVTQNLGTEGEEFTEFYHVTSKEAAETIRNEGINIEKSRFNLDFGRGFYTSTDLKQVTNFAQRNLNTRFKDGYEILSFRVRTGDLTSLRGKLFSAASEEWEQFVLNGRLDQLKHFFDYVVGPLLRNPEGFTEGTQAARSSGVQISWNSPEAIQFLYERLVR